MFINPVIRFQTPVTNQQNNAAKFNFNRANLENDKFIKQSTTNKASNPSISFGLSLTNHAVQRMEERGIAFDNIIETLKEGRKFLQRGDGKGGKIQGRVVNLGCQKEGEIPENTMVVVTDITGDKIITTYKTLSNRGEIQDGKLNLRSYHNPENTSTCDEWFEKFNDKIFDNIREKAGVKGCVNGVFPFNNYVITSEGPLRYMSSYTKTRFRKADMTEFLNKCKIFENPNKNALIAMSVENNKEPLLVRMKNTSKGTPGVYDVIALNKQHDYVLREDGLHDVKTDELLPILEKQS